MKLRTFIQNDESLNEDFQPLTTEAMDVEDLLEQIAEAKEKAEETGISFSEDLEVVEEGNGSLKVVSHALDSEEKMVFKISNFKNRLDQDQVRDYLVSKN